MQQNSTTFERFAPKQNFVLVSPDEIEKAETTEGGIYLADGAQPAVVPRTGMVSAIGPDCTFAVVGERVMFSAYAGTEIEVAGEKFLFMPEFAIIAGV